MHTSRLTAPLLGLLLLASGPLTGCGRPGPPTGIQAGGLARVEQALEALRGQAVLLNFWATWCPPCVAEISALTEAVQAHAASGARVLGVSFDLVARGVRPEEGLQKVRSFLAAREIELPTILVEPGAVAELQARFELPGGIPVTLAYDRTGKLVDRQVGEASRERFEEMLRTALAAR